MNDVFGELELHLKPHDLEPLNGDDTNGHLDNLIRLYKENLLFYMSTDDIEQPDFYLLKE